MKKILVYVPESGAMEAISPAYRIFKTANEFLVTTGKKPLFDVSFTGLKRQMKIQEGEYILPVHYLLEEAPKADLIIIPALFGNLNQALAANKKAIPWLQEHYKKGAELASLCIGAFLLAATGLVDGKKCSTHWAFYNEFHEQFPQVHLTDGSVITDEGRIYSSGGANSSLNLLLYLLEKYTNREVAILAAKYFAIDIDRNNQGAFTIFTGQKEHQDAAILKAQLFIEKNYTEKITIDDLTTKVNVSRRSFERRFKTATNNTVVEYVQRVRIEAAKRSFEASRKNVNEVMYDVGYSDTKAFRDVFKKITGLTPVEYRNKYSKIHLN